MTTKEQEIKSYWDIWCNSLSKDVQELFKLREKEIIEEFEKIFNKWYIDFEKEMGGWTVREGVIADNLKKKFIIKLKEKKQ